MSVKKKNIKKEIVGTDVFLFRTFGISRVLDQVGVEYDHLSLWIGSDYFFLDFDGEKNIISLRRNLMEDVCTKCKKSSPIRFIGKTNHLPEKILIIGQEILKRYPNSRNNSIPFIKEFLEYILCSIKEFNRFNWETLDLDSFIRISKQDQTQSTQSCTIL